jgi:ribosome recycling factor
MIDEISTEAKEQMTKNIEVLKKQLSSIRAGRANVNILDGVMVDYYGSKSPLSQVASLSMQDGGMIMVKPWEKNLLKEIEKSIFEAQLGLTPTNDGDFVRISVPPLSEERRREFAKQAKQRCEDAKIAVRNARRDANEMLKAATKDSEISEDDEKRGLKMVQDLTDDSVKTIDALYAKKEGEILEV